MADAHDWDIKYRPPGLDGVIGQDTAVKTVRGWKRVPRAVLFHGPSGTGKTTLARAVVRELLDMEPSETNMDYQEKNCGVVESSIEMVRDIDRGMTASPLGPYRVYVLDEVQCLSRQKYAQEALLKVLEECPDHARFFLCTTDPQRLLASIRNRCERVAISAVKADAMRKHLQRIAKEEAVDPPFDDRVFDKIVESAGGCVRDAVKQLQKVAGIADAQTRLDAIGGTTADGVAFDLACALMPFRGTPTWADVAKVLVALKEADVEPETARQVVIATARTHLLKGNNLAQSAYKVIKCLWDPMYDKASGNAQLAASCYQIVHSPK